MKDESSVKWGRLITYIIDSVVTDLYNGKL